MILPTGNVCDLELETVEWTREWIQGTDWAIEHANWGLSGACSDG